MLYYRLTKTCTSKKTLIKNKLSGRTMISVIHSKSLINISSLLYYYYHYYYYAKPDLKREPNQQ